MRRRLRRRRALVLFFILLLLLFVAMVYGLRQSAVRISRVQVFGGDTSLSEYATSAMQGSYLGIIPRDSIFFFPEDRIRVNILAAHPEIAALSIFRNGLTGISIKMNNRVPVARWCGSAPATRPDLNATSSRSDLVAQEECYLFDAKGFIFAMDSTSSPQATQPMNSFVVYESLPQTTSPIGSTLPNATEFPSAFDFARQLSTFGSTVTQIAFRADEIDDTLTSGTRVTYVLGDEQNAFTALSSARESFNLADGSLEYVDLRFDGKMYIKKKAVGSKQEAGTSDTVSE